MNIADVEGIGPEHAAALGTAGVQTTEDLLARGGSASGREDLEVATGISHKLILEWVNHVDLMRIDGVGSEYADLLEAAGVDSPAELAQRNATNLAGTFQEVVAARPEIVRRIPSEDTVVGWIEQAKTLPKVVTHGGASARAEAAPAQAERATPGPAPAPAPAPAPGAPAPADAPVAAPASTHADAPTAPAAAPVPRPLAAQVRAPAPARAQEGLLARIKRMIGMG